MVIYIYIYIYTINAQLLVYHGSLIAGSSNLEGSLDTNHWSVSAMLGV